MSHPDQAGAIDESAVDKVVQEAMKLWQVPGLSIAVVHKDQVVYLKGFGVRELGKTDAVTPDTQFAIGSTTKAFTTTAMAILVDEGKMKWDDPVRKHIDWFKLSDPLADGQVTLRDLVTHRTGVEGHDSLWYGTSLNREEVLRRAAHLPMKHPFRSIWDYNNLMYSAAGYAAGKADGSTWEEVVRKRILDPLGMTNTNFSTTEAIKSADHATPHRKKQKKVEPIAWRNIDNIGPAGSINAGARDMVKWVRMQLGKGKFEGKRIISAEALAKTHQPQMVVHMEGLELVFPDSVQTTYAMGWLVQDYHGRPIVEHNGGIDGFSAHVALYPKDKLGIVILANMNEVQIMELGLTQSIADMVLGLPKTNWLARMFVLEGIGNLAKPFSKAGSAKKQHKDTKPSRDLEAYAGAYEDPAYGIATVTLVDGALQIKWDRFRINLTHFHFDVFKAKWDDPMMDEEGDVEFSLDANGDVKELKFSGLGTFKRSKPK